MTTLQQIAVAENWEKRVNENFAATSTAAMYAFDPTSANLDLKIKGGNFGITPISDYASTLTASSGNNYVVYARADGAISRATNTTNWNDDANYGRIGIANAGPFTFAWTDSRTGPFVPPAGGTVSTVNGQSGTVVLDLGDINDVDLTGLTNGDTLVWDSGTSTWVPGTGGGGGGAVASVNGQTGAVVLDSDDIAEGSTNLWFTDGRVRSAVLTGLSLLTGGVIAATDTVLQAFGKLQKQYSDLLAALEPIAISGAASDVSIVDSGGYFTSSNVEGALQELGAGSGGGGGVTIDASLADVISGTTTLSAVDAGSVDKMTGWDDSAGKQTYFALAYGLKTNGTDLRGALQTLAIACSDLITNLTAGTGKAYFYAPYDFTVVEVQASVDTVQSAGSILTVDINESGSTILSTKLTIDNTEGSSITAATPPVISDPSLTKGNKITVDIDQVGTAGARGLIVYIIGYPT